MTTWDEAKALLAERLRARAEFWRLKARESLSPSIDQCMTRADESDACADIAEALSPSYIPPLESDIAAARASRRKK